MLGERKSEKVFKTQKFEENQKRESRKCWGIKIGEKWRRNEVSRRLPILLWRDIRHQDVTAIILLFVIMIFINLFIFLSSNPHFKVKCV